MNGWISLPTAAGDVQGWLAVPATPSTRGLVVAQEIFGVNPHIRDVADGYAEDGFIALAPAFFDLDEPDVELAYDPGSFARGKSLAAAVGFERAIQIVDAAAHRLRDEGATRIGVVGFCWGGSVAYLANTRLGLPAVSYYGARTVPFLAEPLRVPMIFHFGAKDDSIPPADIDAHRSAHPKAEVYEGAGHAFNRNVDSSHFHAEAAATAHARTLEFFRTHLA